MNQVVALRTNRDYYDVREAAEYSLTVDELIDILSNYSGNAKVVFSNDNGYTYGVVSDNTVKNIRVRMNESLISKYGKDEVMNEVNAKTYFDAGRKSFVKGQFNRANRFYDAATRKFRRDEETEEFDITDDGFEVWLPKEEKSIKLYYDLDEDQMYVDDYFHSERILREVGPFSQEIRTEDRKIIRMILNYFKEFNPDSQYNKKAMYIA